MNDPRMFENAAIAAPGNVASADAGDRESAGEVDYAAMSKPEGDWCYPVKRGLGVPAAPPEQHHYQPYFERLRQLAYNSGRKQISHGLSTGYAEVPYFEDAVIKVSASENDRGLYVVSIPDNNPCLSIMPDGEVIRCHGAFYTVRNHLDSVYPVATPQPPGDHDTAYAHDGTLAVAAGYVQAMEARRREDVELSVIDGIVDIRTDIYAINENAQHIRDISDEITIEHITAQKIVDDTAEILQSSLPALEHVVSDLRAELAATRERLAAAEADRDRLRDQIIAFEDGNKVLVDVKTNWQNRAIRAEYSEDVINQALTAAFNHIDDISPMEAYTRLYELKRKVGK